MDSPEVSEYSDDIFEILHYANSSQSGFYTGYKYEDESEAEEESYTDEKSEEEASEEEEGSHESEGSDVILDYMGQLEAKMKQEQIAKAELKKEQLRSLMNVDKVKDSVSKETVLTSEEAELTPEEMSSESSIHPCLKTVDISDSRLKLANLYTMYPVPEDPGLILAYWTIHPRPRAYKEDGIEKFFDIVEKLGIAPIRGMREMLLTNKIDLRYYGINPRIVRAICEALELNQSVHVIDLKDNWLSADACYFLGQLLQKNSILTGLHLSGCRIGRSGAAKLANGISSSTSLMTLDLSGCNLDGEALDFISDAVCNSVALEVLSLNNNDLNETSASALQRLVSCSSTLKQLNLSWNSLYAVETWKSLIKGLGKSSLTGLDLSWNSLGSECVPFLTQFLTRSLTLEKLNLSSNRFVDTDAASIAKALAKNQVLQELYLGNNALKAEGVLALAQALTAEKSPGSDLRILDLTNMWAKKDIVPLLDSIKNTKPWLEIRLGGILSNYKVSGPNIKKILFNRANYEAMKSRSKKMRKDFGQFVLSLSDEPVSKGKFKQSIQNFKLKLSETLLNEIINEFPGPKGRVDQKLLKSTYLEEYPNTQLAPIKIRKPKNVKKVKKSKKVTQ